VSERKPATEMTRRELADEINEADRREAGPWSDEEWRRFLDVASEFISRIGQQDIEVEIKRTKRIVVWLFAALLIILVLLGLVIFGFVHIEVIMR